MAEYSLGNIKILVVEDHAQMRSLLVAMLRALGVGTVDGVGTGKTALNKLGREKSDLVFTTSLEGEVTGIDFIEKIRRNGSDLNKTIPIIMVSGLSTPDYIMKARDAGADEFLAKPYTSDLVYSRIKSVIERRRNFVRGGNFFGPERRRKMMPFEGRNRREVEHEY